MRSNLGKAGLLAGRLLKMMIVNPRGLREISGVALSLSEDFINPDIDVLPIPAVDLVELMSSEPSAICASFYAFPKETFSISVAEAVSLAFLMRKARARRAFEFGTHRGVSTTQLAANLPEGGTVTTLDLPRQDRRTRFDLDTDAEREVASYPMKGDLIPPELRARVEFLEGDSALFDPRPYERTMDFVFVDAAHVTEYVRNDSEKGWLMLRPGGIIAWHDCRAQTPDVSRFLRTCPYSPRRIPGTSIAFAIKPPE